MADPTLLSWMSSIDRRLEKLQQRVDFIVDKHYLLHAKVVGISAAVSTMGRPFPPTLPNEIFALTASCIRVVGWVGASCIHAIAFRVFSLRK